MHIATGQMYIATGQLYVATGWMYIATGQLYDLMSDKYITKDIMEHNSGSVRVIDTLRLHLRWFHLMFADNCLGQREWNY